MSIKCESCAETDPQTEVQATTRSTNREWSGYELCAECASHYDSLPPVRYEIQTQYMGKYGIVFSEWSDELGETVSYPTRESARLAIEDLRELGDEWKQARYRVVEVKR